MKKIVIGILFMLVLVVGLKDGRMWEIPGNPPVVFQQSEIKGKMVDCVIIVIEGQGYALPVAMLKVLFYKPEYTI